MLPLSRIARALDVERAVEPVYVGGELPGLHRLKFLCALLVVCIHVPSDANVWIDPLLRIAVPVFFFITGYFMIGRDGLFDLRRISKAIKKLIILTIAINLVYACYRLYQYLQGDTALGENLLFRPNTYIASLFYDCRFCVALWYLSAVVEALMVIYLLVKLRLTNLLWALMIVGLILNVVIGKYSILFMGVENPSHYSRNVFTVGLPCVFIGAMIRRYQPYLKLSKSVVGLIIVCSIIEYITLYFHPVGYGDVYLTTVPLAIVVFLMFLSDRRPADALSYLGQRCATSLYLFHMLCYWVMLEIVAEADNLPFRPLIVATVVVVVTLGYYYVRDRIRTCQR